VTEWRWRNCIVAFIIAVAGWVASTAFVTPVLAQPAQCTVLDSCSGINSLPTASQCEEDDCTCAQQIECYVRNQEPLENYKTAPGGGLQLNRNFFHNRFIKTLISPKGRKAWKYYKKHLDEDVVFPDGTVVYKAGYLPKDKNVAKPDRSDPSAYMMVKIEGYCPDGSSVGDYCLGGDWFSAEVNLDDNGVVSGGSILDGGKSSKCFGCHAAAEKSDWMWKLFSDRRYP